MKVLAVTGGIGSGKSYIVRIFNAIGIPSYDADTEAKSLYSRKPEILQRVAQVAGSDIVRDGVLQKQVLAARIFSDPSLLSEVERIVHPAVLEDFIQWKAQREREGAELVLLESAIVLEKPAFLGCYDKVLTIIAPLEIRIERVMRRDRCTRDAALARIGSQASDSYRQKASDFTIFASDSDALLPQIVRIIKMMK
ncbi:MAG: dephospho-CoA kinase [Bacteroidales bacterium]